MKTCADYIADTKVKLGDPRMPDGTLGGRLPGYSQQAISAAKRGKMTDPIAIKMAEILGIEPGEILLVARMEREKDPAVRVHLEKFVFHVGKLLDSASKNVAKAGVAGLAMALGLWLSPTPSDAAAGGVGDQSLEERREGGGTCSAQVSALLANILLQSARLRVGAAGPPLRALR